MLPAAHASDKAAPWPAYVKASVAWHAGAGAARDRRAGVWPWALGAVAANHVALTAGGLWPRSRWLGSNWTRLPARRRGAARDRDHHRRRPRSGGDAGRPRPARRARRAGDLLLHRRSAARAHPALCREIVRARPQRAEPQRSPLASLLAARAEGDGARDRRRAGVARRHHRRGAALLPRSRRAAQSVPRAGAAAPRPAARQLDAARLRHRAARSGRRAGAPRARPRRPATSCSLHDGNAARDRRRPRRCSSPCCRRCSSARASPACVAVTLPAASLQRRGDDAAAPAAAQRAHRHEQRRRGGRLARAGRGGERAVSARRPLRLALRARQAALGSGLRPSARARPDRAANARPRHRLRPGAARQPARGGGAGGAPGPLAERLGRGAGRRSRQRHRPAARATSRAPAHALGDGIDIVCADMRTTAFAAVDAVVILDVLHYVSIAEQDARARARARRPADRRPAGAAHRRRGGAARLRRERSGSTASSRCARGQGVGRQTGRTLAAWQARLADARLRGRERADAPRHAVREHPARRHGRARADRGEPSR